MDEGQPVRPADAVKTAIPADERRPVDVAAIERELARLWEPATASPGQPGPAAIRACALTLVVCVDSAAAAEGAAAAIARVATRDPCRAIVVVAGAEPADPPLAAWVSARCYLPGPGGSPVCCEQIDVVADPTARAQVPGLVRTLLAPELPVVLWWPGDPPLHSPLLSQLADIADRVVLDSAAFAAPCPTLARVADLAAARPQLAAFSDLSWARLTPWRDLVAQFFDPPAWRPYLERIDSVTVDCATSGEPGQLNQAEALLFAGWLASRLGWRPEPAGDPECQDGCQRLLRDRRGQTVAYVARAIPGGSESGQLAAVTLHAGGEPGATFSIVAADEYATTTAEVAGAAAVRRVSRLARADLARLLGQELEALERDRVFEEALALAGALAAAPRGLIPGPAGAGGGVAPGVG